MSDTERSETDKFAELLGQIAEYTPMYIGRTSLQGVVDFINGYDCALMTSGVDRPLAGWQDWVAWRFDGPPSIAWWGILRQQYDDEELAIAALPGLYAEFLATRDKIGGEDAPVTDEEWLQILGGDEEDSTAEEEQPKLTASIGLLSVPYDSGRASGRMADGPTDLLASSYLSRRLQERGCRVQSETIRLYEPFLTENTAAFALHRAIAERVRHHVQAGSLPIVLSGNCNAAVGTLTGLGVAPDLGVVWLDAHGEFNTPETTRSGFLDGMGLAIATGRCWRRMTADIPHFVPLPDNQIVLVGARALDDTERENLAHSQIVQVDMELIRQMGMRDVLARALEKLPASVRRIYLHLDPDVLDPAEGVANPWPEPGGISASDLNAAVALVGERFTLAAVGIASYDPEADWNKRVHNIIYQTVEQLAALDRKPA